jgi:competence protein ComEA
MAWTKREWAGVAIGVFVLGTIGTGIAARNAGGSPVANGPSPSASGETRLAFEIPADANSAPDHAASPSPSLSVPAPPSASPVVETVAPPTPGVKLKVFVSGAVKRPGVYGFAPGARIEDAVRTAGGFKPNADMAALNLADFLRDADQINVPAKAATARVFTSAVTVVRGNNAPTVRAASVAPKISPLPPVSVERAREGVPVSAPTPGRVLGKVAVPEASGPDAVLVAQTGASEAGAKSTRSASGSSASDKFKNPGDGVIDLNTATEAEFQKLPGVGPSTAAHIMEYRKQIGKFTSVEQIMDIKGIGPKKFAKMQPFLTVK